MKRNRYFMIVILSSLLFLACLLMLFRRQNRQKPAEGETETIDFSELGKTEETPLSENTETQIQTEQNTDHDADTAFYTTGLTEELKARITGKSYPDTTESIQISYDALAYVHILHYDFQAQVQEG